MSYYDPEFHDKMIADRKREFQEREAREKALRKEKARIERERADADRVKFLSDRKEKGWMNFLSYAVLDEPDFTLGECSDETYLRNRLICSYDSWKADPNGFPDQDLNVEVPGALEQMLVLEREGRDPFEYIDHEFGITVWSFEYRLEKKEKEYEFLKKNDPEKYLDLIEIWESRFNKTWPGYRPNILNNEKLHVQSSKKIEKPIEKELDVFDKQKQKDSHPQVSSNEEPQVSSGEEVYYSTKGLARKCKRFSNKFLHLFHTNNPRQKLPSINSTLSKIRKRLNLGYYQLPDLFGIDQKQYIQWLSGKHFDPENEYNALILLANIYEHGTGDPISNQWLFFSKETDTDSSCFELLCSGRFNSFSEKIEKLKLELYSNETNETNEIFSSSEITSSEASSEKNNESKDSKELISVEDDKVEDFDDFLGDYLCEKAKQAGVRLSFLENDSIQNMPSSAPAPAIALPVPPVPKETAQAKTIQAQAAQAKTDQAKTIQDKVNPNNKIKVQQYIPETKELCAIIIDALNEEIIDDDFNLLMYHAFKMKKEAYGERGIRRYWSKPVTNIEEWEPNEFLDAKIELTFEHSFNLAKEVQLEKAGARNMLKRNINLIYEFLIQRLDGNPRNMKLPFLSWD